MGEQLSYFSGEGLYQVHMRFNNETGSFESTVSAATGGVDGMLMQDAYPSIWLVVRAQNPAHAVAKAWDTIQEVNAQPTRLAASQEEFIKHVAEHLTKAHKPRYTSDSEEEHA